MAEVAALAAWPGVAAAIGAPSSVAALVLLSQWLLDRRDKRAASQGQISDLAAQRILTLVDQLQEELARATAALDAHRHEIDLYRGLRWQVEDRIAEMRDAAIAARAMVHDLERRLGQEATEFPHLPEIIARPPVD